MASYDPPKFDSDGRPSRITSGGKEFVVARHMDMPSGYQGSVYQDFKAGDYVVAHRGTEFDRELLKDGLVDLGMVTGRINAQRHDALELTRIALQMAQRDGTQLSVTGHSLGGALAQITAHHYNLPGEAFNPYGAAGLLHRIAPGQPAHAARFSNHVMAGDFVSAASTHYGSVQIYALASELELLREAEKHARATLPFLGAGSGIAVAPVLMVTLADSHRMRHFIDRLDETPPGRSVLDDPAARIRDPADQQRVDAFRDNVHTLRSGITLLARGGPFLLYDQLHRSRGHDEPGAYADRQAHAAEWADRPFNPNLQRGGPAYDGSPSLEHPSFHTRSPLQQRLDDLLGADPERFTVLNRQAAELDPGRQLDTQARINVDAEERAREHSEALAQQQAVQAEQRAPVMQR